MFKRELKDGKKEFPINREALSEDGRELFDSMVTHACALAGSLQHKHDDEEEKHEAVAEVPVRASSTAS